MTPLGLLFFIKILLNVTLTPLQYKHFKKVETYNEVAEMMGTDKAKLVLTDIDDKFGYAKVEGSFKTYKEFTKFVKDEYFKDVAENLIKSKDWEMDGEITFQWGWNKEYTCKYGIELAAI